MSAAMATGVIESYMSSGSTGFRHGDFVHVTLVFDKLSPHLRRILDVTCLVIAAAFTHESWGVQGNGDRPGGHYNLACAIDLCQRLLAPAGRYGRCTGHAATRRKTELSARA